MKIKGRVATPVARDIGTKSLAAISSYLIAFCSLKYLEPVRLEVDSLKDFYLARRRSAFDPVRTGQGAQRLVSNLPEFLN